MPDKISRLGLYYVLSSIQFKYKFKLTRYGLIAELFCGQAVF